MGEKTTVPISEVPMHRFMIYVKTQDSAYVFEDCNRIGTHGIHPEEPKRMHVLETPGETLRCKARGKVRDDGISIAPGTSSASTTVCKEVSNFFGGNEVSYSHRLAFRECTITETGAESLPSGQSHLKAHRAVSSQSRHLGSSHHKSQSAGSQAQRSDRAQSKARRRKSRHLSSDYKY